MRSAARCLLAPRQLHLVVRESAIHGAIGVSLSGVVDSCHIEAGHRKRRRKRLDAGSQIRNLVARLQRPEHTCRACPLRQILRDHPVTNIRAHHASNASVQQSGMHARVVLSIRGLAHESIGESVLIASPA